MCRRSIIAVLVIIGLAITFAPMSAMPPAEPPPPEQRLAAMEQQVGGLMREMHQLRQELDKAGTEIWIVSLKKLDARTVVKALEPLVKEMGGIISADIRSNSLVISATKARQPAITRMILRLDIKAMGTEPDTDIVDVGSADASKLAEALNRLYQDQPADFEITADKLAHVVIIKGPRAFRKEIKGYVNVINNGVSCGPLTIVKLKHLEAVAVADALRSAITAPDGVIAGDPESNSIFITAATRAKSDQIQKMIEALDAVKKE